jgi:hypothetical protein
MEDGFLVRSCSFPFAPRVHVYEAFRSEIAKLATWVKSAGLPESSRVLWCVSRLPSAYKEFAGTYESRYAVDIARHELAALVHLAEELGESAGARVEKLRVRFQTLNERFGLPALPSPTPRARAETKAPREQPGKPLSRRRQRTTGKRISRAIS